MNVNKNVLIILGAAVFIIAFYLISTNQSNTQPSNNVTPTEDTVMEDEIMSNSMTITLSEQNESGETGTAELVEENGQTVVTLNMQGSPEGVPQPAHIHTGSCPDVGGVEYPLTNVENGESVTSLDVTLEQLESEMPLAINVHKSVPEASVYTACGDLEF